MAFVSQQPSQHSVISQHGVIRPVLISRHSCSLPSTHLHPKPPKAVNRRCRSASPPVKKRSNTSSWNNSTLNTTSQFRRLDAINKVNQSSQDEILPAQHLIQQPIIKTLTSSYLVRQPKVVKLSSSNSKVRSQVLCDHKRSLSISSVLDKISFTQYQGDYGFVLSPADINGNHTRTSIVKKDAGKLRKLKASHAKTLSLPVSPSCDNFDENLLLTIDEKVEPARKRPSYSGQVKKPLFDTLLPLECKLKIFSYLSHCEKGQCMFVSKEWYHMIRLPELWRNIDFREFKLCSGHSVQDEHKENSSLIERANFNEASAGSYQTDDYSSYTKCTQACYTRYIDRIENFTSFLIDIRAKVRRLAFAFDLISDNWSARMDRFIIHVNLSELEYANINWRDTPVKPYWLDQPEPALNDLLHKTRRRQRVFLNFFELFVQEAPNVVSLILPFDWSHRSINYLISLKKLRNLTIEKYFVLQTISQEALNSLSKIRNLERLVLEVWNPSAAGIFNYSLTSKTLKYLDLSQCRGFYLSNIDLPLLEVFITERRPWNGQLTFTSQLEAMNVFCLQEMLTSGARKLKRINSVTVNSPDSWDLSALTDLMNKICPCRLHKSGLVL